jgi:hypothetical protein
MDEARIRHEQIIRELAQQAEQKHGQVIGTVHEELRQQFVLQLESERAMMRAEMASANTHLAEVQRWHSEMEERAKREAIEQRRQADLRIQELAAAFQGAGDERDRAHQQALASMQLQSERAMHQAVAAAVAKASADITAVWSAKLGQVLAAASTASASASSAGRADPPASRQTTQERP